MLGLGLLACAGTASAQVYKWKDAKGVTHFSDAPPASMRDKAEVRHYDTGASNPPLPYELARAARANPVVLYTAQGCAPCEQGRALLLQRGVPFAEKTVENSDDQQQLKEAGSDGQLPLLLVGRMKFVGLQPAAWNDALSAAAYPARSILPRGYRQAQATTAAPRGPSPQELARREAEERAALAKAEAEERARFAPKPKAINGTPDFQF